MTLIHRCLLLFVLFSYAAAVPLADTPSWFYGNAFKFQRYDDPFCSTLPANKNATNIGLFGGLYSFSVPLTREACLKIPTNKLGQPTNTWVKFSWLEDTQLRNDLICHPGNSYANIQLELYYYTNPTCSGSWVSTDIVWQQTGPEPPFQPLRDTTACLRDRGTTTGTQYYRIFCDVPEPNITSVVPIYITNNITTFVPRYITNNITTYIPITNNITTFVPSYITYNITNNITTFVPSIVKAEDLIPLISALMAQNASLFKTTEAKNTIEAPSNNPPPTNSKTTSSGPGIDMGLVIFLVVFGCLFFFA